MNPAPVTHEIYSQRLWRRFYADSFARNGLCVVVVLFIVAALAPFLANSHAIIRVAGGHISFPVFLSLEPIEWRFLLYVPLAGLIYFFQRRLLARPRFFALSLIGLIAFIEIILGITHPR